MRIRGLNPGTVTLERVLSQLFQLQCLVPKSAVRRCLFPNAQSASQGPQNHSPATIRMSHTRCCFRRDRPHRPNPTMSKTPALGSGTLTASSMA